MELNKKKILDDTNYYHLKKFKGFICNQAVEGLIYIERDAVYLFQNKRDGGVPNNTYSSDWGYKYSWVWDHNVKNIELMEEDGWKVVIGSIADVALTVLNPIISDSFDSDLKFNIAKKKEKKGKGTTPFKLKLFY